MKRIVTTFVAFIAFLSASPFCRAEQTPSVVQFLDRLAAAPDDQTAQQAQIERGTQEAQILSTAPRSEVEASLPTILAYAGNTSQNSRVREQATMFLLNIAMRGGPDLLSSHSADIAELLTDSDPVVQRFAANITYIVIDRNNGEQSETYVTELAAAVRNLGTPQDIAAQMLLPLLRYGAGQPALVDSIHNFLTRSDLKPQAKIDSIRPLAMLPNLPEQISHDLCTRFDDPDPHVRIAAIIAYSNAASQQSSAARYLSGADPIPSEDPQEAAQRREAAASALNAKFAFVGEARKHVERIATDGTENPKVRQLAKDALAGRTGLNPNILEPNVVDPEGKPINPP